MISLFDTHAHLDMIKLPSEGKKWLENGVYSEFPPPVPTAKDFENKNIFQMAGILCPGISLESSRRAIEFAANSNKLYAAIGLHPNNKVDLNDADWDKLLELSKNQHVTAIGETGLDRYRDVVPFEKQLIFFERHLDLAKTLNLPIIVHSRDCDDDMFRVLGNRAKESQLFGVIHSFSSCPVVAERYLEMGLCVSFSGSVTYTNKKFAGIWDAAKIVPDDRLLIETDSPFLTPHPYRGKLDDNVPLMTAFVAKRLAELRGTTLAHIAEVTTANAERIFRKK